MKKRLAVWIILAVMLFAAVPAWAAPGAQVEDFTVERDGSVITVTLPADYAAKGYFKLFWKNEATGEVLSDVFPVDTPSYRIDAEEGAEYSFQLHYNMRTGKLPARWKEDLPAPTPSGPSVWKVLWIDAAVIDFRGYTTQMNENNYQSSGEIAQAFEAFAEELTLGRVDIEITRMTLDVPITELEYQPERGYMVYPDNCDMKHYAMRKYDSVFLVARFDHIIRRLYAGLTVMMDNAKETPGFSFIPIYGDDLLPRSTIETLRDVSVHEWIHQLGNLYQTYHLDIPDPDEPDKYGYLPYEEGGGLEHGLFREILTMTAVSEDGRYIGVPAEAWQYKPTKYAQVNLSSLQQEKAPSGPASRKEEPAPAETAARDVNPEVFGTLDEVNGIYSNSYMGLAFNGSGWVFYSEDSMPYTGSDAEPLEDDPDFIKNGNSIIAAFAADASEPSDIYLMVDTASVPFIRENGEDAYILELQKNFERWAEQGKCEDVSSERITRTVGGRTLPGIRFLYVSGGVRTWQELVFWIEDDHLNRIVADSCMFDLCRDILNRFSWLE